MKCGLWWFLVFNWFTNVIFGRIVWHQEIRFLGHIEDLWPLGLFAPFVDKAKPLFQKLRISRSQMGWKVRPPDLVKQWRAWTADLMKLCFMETPRRINYTPLENQGDVTPHIFDDANEKAHGASSYVTSNDSKSLCLQFCSCKGVEWHLLRL